jgi:predicted nucleic acid-binding protein
LTFVIDASVVVAWCLQDESSEAAEAAMERLLAEGGIAPAHWPIEIASALRSAERRGRLDESSIGQLQPRLTALPIEILPDDLRSALSVIDIARRHDLSVYDASYLDLAEMRGLGLATVDVRLARACRTAGIPLIAA